VGVSATAPPSSSGGAWFALVVAIGAAVVATLFLIETPAFALPSLSATRGSAIAQRKHPASERGRPVSLGRAQMFGDWKLSVDAVAWNPNSWALGVEPPPPGDRNIAITMAVQYFGPGHAGPPFRFFAEGADHARYDNFGHLERVVLMWGNGSREQFLVGFTVARSDLNTLRLYVYYDSSQTPVQFALQRR
jgi:hypothetical protein